MSHFTRRAFLAAVPVGLSPLGAVAPLSRSPFLAGEYAPVQEETTADNLPIVGKLPAELDGMFVRNGPNPQFTPRNDYHWFDGDGMLHGVRLQGGKASYRNRYIRTDGWQEENKAGKSLYDGLLGRPDLTKIAAGKEGFKNTANTALVWHNGKLLALWEGGVPHAIRVPSLETIGRHTFEGRLRHACTAHPKVDPVSGEMYFFGYQPVRPYVQYSIADAKGVIKHTTPIDIPRPVMMHDFALTARHALFLDLPVTFGFGRLLRGQSPFAYEPKHGARVGILPRQGQGKEVRWFSVAPCYVFHVLNAWEEGDEVVLVACRMPGFPSQITPPDQLSERELKAIGSTPHRWRFNLKTGQTREEALSDEAADFPRINESHTGRRSRYGYFTPLRMTSLVKHDLEGGKSERHDPGRGRVVGEGVFVPRRGAKTEDDGWLMTYVYDRQTRRSELLVIDAREFSGRPTARVLLPVRVPLGFHGTWVGLA